MCDSKGVIYKGRENIDQFKSAAIDTNLRTLKEAIKDADVFLGLSAKDVVSKRWLNLWQITQSFCLCKSIQKLSRN